MTLSDLRRAWSSFVANTLLHSTDTEEQRHAFRQHAIENTLRYSRPVAMLGIVAALVWWPGDFYIYRHRPDAFAAFTHWRVVASLICNVYLLTAGRIELARRYVSLWAVAFASLLSAGVSFFLSEVGGLESAPFHSLYLAPMVTFALFVPVGWRIVATFAVLGSALLAFFAPHPEYLRYPHLGNVAGVMLFAVSISVSVGHALYHLSHVMFFQAREIEHRAQQLDELTGRLSIRVAERTAELSELRAHLESTREQERTSLSRELHDELGQLLTAMRLELDVAKEAANAAPARLEDQLSRLDTLLSRTLEATRAVIMQLRPRVLDDFGLPGASEWLVVETRRRTGLDIALRIEPPDLTLAPAIATALYRVLQESLTNVVRHAKATHVDVSIVQEQNGHVELSVADDGCGLPMEQRSPGSFGLLGIRERLTSLGGTLELVSPPDSGLRLIARVPPPAPTQEVA